jgi:hypothetical protein
MKRLSSKVLVALLIFILVLTSSAQQVTPLTKQAASVKRKAETLALHAPISVIRIHAEEEFGKFLSSNQESFTFYDVDRKAEVTLQYADVKKIKDGYGICCTIQGKHADRTKDTIAIVAVAGLIGGLLIALVSAKD